MDLEGGCFCGEVRYRIAGGPRRVTHCHCIHCRRTSGAPFLTWAECSRRDLAFTKGTPAEFETKARVTRRFCLSCGTQLTYEHADQPGSIDVTAGSLDSPGELTPNDHVWCDRMLPWVKIDDDLPRHGTKRT